MWIAVRQSHHDIVNSFIAIRFSNVEMNGGNGGDGAGHNGDGGGGRDVQRQ